MGLANINTKLPANKGFTIVELLIVIVVIAILAAITIVSYNGITARADSSSAQAKASSVAKKAEAYAAEGTTSGYPTFAQLTAAGASSSPYYVTGVSSTLTAATSSNGKTTIQYLPCGHSGTTTAPNRQASTGTGLVPISVVTGVQIHYYDFANSRVTTTSTNPAGFTVGTISGTVGTYPIACPTTN